MILSALKIKIKANLFQQSKTIFLDKRSDALFSPGSLSLTQGLSLSHLISLLSALKQALVLVHMPSYALQRIPYVRSFV